MKLTLRQSIIDNEAKFQLDRLSAVSDNEALATTVRQEMLKIVEDMERDSPHLHAFVTQLQSGFSKMVPLAMFMGTTGEDQIKMIEQAHLISMMLLINLLNKELELQEMGV